MSFLSLGGCCPGEPALLRSVWAATARWNCLSTIWWAARSQRRFWTRSSGLAVATERYDNQAESPASRPVLISTINRYHPTNVQYVLKHFDGARADSSRREHTPERREPAEPNRQAEAGGGKQHQVAHQLNRQRTQRQVQQVPEAAQD